MSQVLSFTTLAVAVPDLPIRERRGRRPDGDQDRTLRHELSKTESEIEDILCQTDVLGWKEGTTLA